MVKNPTSLSISEDNSKSAGKKVRNTQNFKVKLVEQILSLLELIFVYLFLKISYIILVKIHWRNSDVPNKSVEIINNMGSELKYWDQDILNQIFNEDLYKVENELNYILDIQDNLKVPQEVIFIHYAGSFKPWTTRGAVEKNALMYMENFRKLGMGKFHLTHTWKMSSIFYIIKSIINLKVINTKAPFKFLISFIRSLQD